MGKLKFEQRRRSLFNDFLLPKTYPQIISSYCNSIEIILWMVCTSILQERELFYIREYSAKDVKMRNLYSGFIGSVWESEWVGVVSASSFVCFLLLSLSLICNYLLTHCVSTTHSLLTSCVFVSKFIPTYYPWLFEMKRITVKKKARERYVQLTFDEEFFEKFYVYLISRNSDKTLFGRIIWQR